MHWDAVTKSFCSERQRAILQSFELGEDLDCENILSHNRASYFHLAALAMHCNRLDVVKQLQLLHAEYAYWGERIIPKEMGKWFEAKDIAQFSTVFNIHTCTHWFDVAENMVSEQRNAELQELLQLKDPSGNQVIYPQRSDSLLLWVASSKGNREAFHMLLPVSYLPDDGYRCFIAAVYNDNYDIANDIIKHCLSHNTLKDLMAGVQLFANEKFDDHNEEEDEKVREMVALIQREKIATSVACTGKNHMRKM